MPRGLHCASLQVGRWQRDVCNECGFGSDIMKRDDVAVVCVLVLLLRLGRFPEPLGFAELRPLFRMCVYALDAYVDGLCVDVRDDVQRFVVEATLQVERSWVNWDLVAAARSRLFVHWLNVWGTCSVRQKSRLAPYLLCLTSRLFRMWPDGGGAAMGSGVRLG